MSTTGTAAANFFDRDKKEGAYYACFSKVQSSCTRSYLHLRSSSSLFFPENAQIIFLVVIDCSKIWIYN